MRTIHRVTKATTPLSWNATQIFRELRGQGIGELKSCEIDHAAKLKCDPEMP